MRDFYTSYYRAMERSRAHAEFCERVFGANLCQHGFADMAQLDLLLVVTQLGPGNHALDLGCGNGLIAEYLSDHSGAHITGLDYIPEAIAQACERTRAKAACLDFVVGDINALKLPPGAFDTILSIDTLYFADDLPRVIGQLKEALTPDGQMAILFSHGWEPWTPQEQFPVETLPPDQTPLAKALQANDLCFRTWDLTSTDYGLAQLRKQVLTELKPQFEAEGNLFIWENRWGDANGISRAIEAGLQKRYLYHVRFQTSPAIMPGTARPVEQDR
jgi:SAM-dependent methyltransferase